MKIKTVLFILSVLFLVIDQSMGQSYTVKYSYDASGNRVKRFIEESDSQENFTGDSVRYDTLAKEPVNGKGKGSKMVTLFPNPTQGVLNLELKGFTEYDKADYMITSLTGQNMLHQRVTASVTRIDISSLSPGTYIVRVSAGGRVETWKIIKNQ